MNHIDAVNAETDRQLAEETAARTEYLAGVERLCGVTVRKATYSRWISSTTLIYFARKGRTGQSTGDFQILCKFYSERYQLDAQLSQAEKLLPLKTRKPYQSPFQLR